MKPVIWEKRSVAYLAALFCNLLWGSAFAFIKIGYELFEVAAEDTTAQMLFAGIRFLLAGILTICFEGIMTRKLPVPKSKITFKKILVLASIQTVLQYIFFYIGLANTNGVKANILITFQVFFSILISSLIFKMETLTVYKIIGSVLGVVGVVLVNLNGIGGVSFVFNGEGFILCTAVCGAFSAVVMKVFSKNESPVLLSGYQFMLGGFVMMAGSFVAGGRLASPNPAAIAVLLYLSFLSAAAYGLWSVILKYHPVSKIAVFNFANPLCGVILSTLLLSESNTAPAWLILLSLVLVCVGITLVNGSFGKKMDKT